MLKDSLIGWRRTFLSDGLVLSAPEGDGRDQETIRIRTRIAPLMRIQPLVEMLARMMPRTFTDVTIGEPSQLTTLEGEYAALVQISAKTGDRRLERTIGLVFGDDFFAAIDGATTNADSFAVFRSIIEKLTTGYCLGLGENRRRLYLYETPRGWQGLRRHHSTLWLPEGYPRRHALLTVFDARPVELGPANVQDRMLFEDLAMDFVPDAPLPPLPLVNRFGLRGQIVTTGGTLPSGHRRAILNCALSDSSTVYFVRLETDLESQLTHRAAFLDVVQSVRPLPVRDHKVGDYIVWQD